MWHKKGGKLMKDGYGILTLIPPLIAILLSFKTKIVVVSLFAGILAGGIIICGGNLFSGIAYSLETIVGSMTDEWNAKLLLFTFFMGAGIAFIWRLGGSSALAERAQERFKSKKSIGIGVWLLGMLTSVNDCLVAAVGGNVFRDISKESGMSSEKLAYSLDSTAAPAAAIFISDWIAYQIGMINEGMKAAGITGIGPVEAYIKSIPFNLYSIFTLIFVGVLMATGNDYGPMLEAENRAMKEGKFVRDGAEPMLDIDSELGEPKTVKPMVRTFVLPIIAAVGMILFGLFWTGRSGNGLMEILENAEADTALLWGSFAMAITGVILALTTKIMGFKETMDTLIDGFKLMVLTGAILIMAWSLSGITKEMELANYIIGSVGNNISFGFLPIVIFLLAMLVSFATGTSWGTMAIMTPLAIPLIYNITRDSHMAVTISGVVLSGAIFGDHCSPISDTTVMASIFSGADHIDHVKTQAPYALTVAFVALIMFSLYGFIGVKPVVFIPLGLALLLILQFIFHKVSVKKRGFAVEKNIKKDIKV